MPVGITHDGRWVLESGDPERLAITAADSCPRSTAAARTVALRQRPGGAASWSCTSPSSVPRALGEVDVVFPLLHGPWGEDGTIQGLLEMAGVRYVGSGVLASAVGMDKHYMKIVLQAHGLPVLPYAVLSDRGLGRRPGRLPRVGGRAGLPGVRQAVPGRVQHRHQQGATTRAELDAAVEEARQHDPKVLVEARPSGGREIECGVLEGFGGARPRPAWSPRSGSTATTSSTTSRRSTSPRSTPSSTSRRPARRASPTRCGSWPCAAFEALSCEGLARVDFFLLARRRLVINEINTMPGFTPTSMFPRMWAASGLDYPAAGRPAAPARAAAATPACADRVTACARGRRGVPRVG